MCNSKLNHPSATRRNHLQPTLEPHLHPLWQHQTTQQWDSQSMHINNNFQPILLLHSLVLQPHSFNLREAQPQCRRVRPHSHLSGGNHYMADPQDSQSIHIIPLKLHPAQFRSSMAPVQLECLQPRCKVHPLRHPVYLRHHLTRTRQSHHTKLAPRITTPCNQLL